MISSFLVSAVRALRIAAGLSQQELAERSGVAQPNIAAYESGQRRPSTAMLRRLSSAAAPRPSVVLAQHRDRVLALAREHKANDVRVFGSVARGEDVSGSDIDLLVRFEPDADVFDMAALVAELEDLTALHVDVVSEGGLRPGPNAVRDEARPL
jgi:predicted nucleotidyltransferase/DNA-binding XRE family transcriptional regulator